MQQFAKMAGKYFQAQTGELTLTQSIDREEYNSIEVVIYASDGVQTTEWKRRIQVKAHLHGAMCFCNGLACLFKRGIFFKEK